VDQALVNPRDLTIGLAAGLILIGLLASKPTSAPTRVVIIDPANRMPWRRRLLRPPLIITAAGVALLLGWAAVMTVLKW